MDDNQDNIQETLVGKKRHSAPELDNYMTGVANRVADSNVGIDPVTVITVLRLVLPIIAKCYGMDTGASPEQLRASLIEQNEKQPQRLRRRLTARYMREAPDHKLTREQAEALADSTINETINTEDAVITGICSALGE